MIAKGEGRLGIRFDFVYWQMMFQLLQMNYEIVYLSPDEREVWLQSTRERKAPLVRLVRTDMDWGVSLKNDMNRALVAVDEWRKRQFRRQLQVINVYVMMYPPVDDWELYVERPFTTGRVHMQTYVMHLYNMYDVLHKLSTQFHQSLKVYVPDDSPMLQQELQTFKQHVLSFAERMYENERRIFERGKARFTYVFIALQIVMFFILEWNGGSTNTLTLIQYGAKFNPLILQGEWWRFFTPIVLHIGFLHLFMNTFALYYLGSLVEKLYGSFRFLFIYLFAGFAGSLASFLFSSSVSAGASGAIFGCFGALLYFGKAKPHIFFRTIGMNVITVIGINLAFGLVVPNIDNAGHIGGLIGGFLAASIVHFPKERVRFGQWFAALFTAVVTFICLYIGFQRPPADQAQLILALSKQYIDEREYGQAEQMLTLIHEQDAEAYKADFLRAYIHIQQKDYDDAKQYLYDAIEKNNRFHEAYYYLALLYAEEKNYEKAKQAAERALQLEPNNEQYQRLLLELEQLL
ncbi:rhomboid family intramembrane serine protease [Anoxybacillus kestanbolensis]|uniref:rhomboid family intramembrane serine protease n=1 Tax=Anoxybacillus kestanbolensis TaxID=227476 RepID=UPI003D1AF71E